MDANYTLQPADRGTNISVKALYYDGSTGNPDYVSSNSLQIQHKLITNSNFQTAVNLWFDNQAEANATYGHISDWNTSAVTDMSNAFRDRTDFNEDISSWDVSKVTNMTRMFGGASSFNQPIGTWDVSSVVSLHRMFLGTSSFNQPLGGWDVSSVTDMRGLFASSAYNQPLGSWDVSSVTDMRGLYE